VISSLVFFLLFFEILSLFSDSEKLESCDRDEADDDGGNGDGCVPGEGVAMGVGEGTGEGVGEGVGDGARGMCDAPVLIGGNDRSRGIRVG